MPIFRKKRDPFSAEARQEATQKYFNDMPHRPVATTEETYRRIRHLISLTFEFETLGFRLMELAPPTDSDGPDASMMRETGQPQSVEYLEMFPPWRSWVTLARTNDPRMTRIREERASAHTTLMNAYWDLTSARAPADLPELGQVQIATELVAGTMTNVFDDEDHGLMYKLLGDERNFTRKATKLAGSKAAAEWAMPRL